jgi:hypothetical protein
LSVARDELVDAAASAAAEAPSPGLAQQMLANPSVLLGG